MSTNHPSRALARSRRVSAPETLSVVAGRPISEPQKARLLEPPLTPTNLKCRRQSKRRMG